MLAGVQGRRREPARLRGEALQLQSQPSLGKEHSQTDIDVWTGTPCGPRLFHPWSKKAETFRETREIAIYVFASIQKITSQTIRICGT